MADEKKYKATIVATIDENDMVDVKVSGELIPLLGLADFARGSIHRRFENQNKEKKP